MTNGPKTFRIITLGCKVNQYESAYFGEALAAAGWRVAGGDETADVVIVNTCIVTQKAAHQSRQAVRKAIREHPVGYVAAVGCYAQVFPEELSEIEGLGLIADNRMKADLPEFLTGADASFETGLLLKPFEPGARFDAMDISRFPGRARAYLKIQDGCESFCSYCIVPFARGPYRSLPPEKVIRRLETLSDQGYGEVVLTGIHLGKYGVDLKGGVDLVSLLGQVGREGFPLRIRLSSIEPNELKMELIEMAASESWLCRHVHIPLQSGDDRVLHRMNRHYTAREFADIVEAVYTSIPHAAIGVDIMAGFPGEDSRAFDSGYSLLKDLPISYLHVFPFSPRPGTAASRFSGRVASEEIKERTARLRALGERKQRLFYQGCLGREFSVLPERWESREKRLMQGRSDNYLPVIFPLTRDSIQGPFRVRMEQIEGRRVIGTRV
ncbi:MAG: tRNA (N(6)-L-threonylcarbamoyladenosine(37)-C(2))-methylthiotransferase MtaB [Deltaproteobacteria bacterium]|nr:tRNA (N(6)-L-threonylcarbamoyladenosine(37)-C(2))-methylthiotransferase MtaB [Deltaproteobacteria bacterium]